MTEPSQTKQVRGSYSGVFKRKAVKLAKKTGSASAAARKLKVPVANLYSWIKASHQRASVKKDKSNVQRKVKTRRTYTAEFKLNAVQRVIESNSVAGTARELKLAVQTLHNWVEAEKAGRLGATVVFTLDELSALQSFCAGRIIHLKKSTAINSPSEAKELKSLIAVSAKLKRRMR